MISPSIHYLLSNIKLSSNQPRTNKYLGKLDQFAEKCMTNSSRENTFLAILTWEKHLELQPINKPPAEPTASNQHHSSILGPPREWRNAAEGPTTLDYWINLPPDHILKQQ